MGDSWEGSQAPPKPPASGHTQVDGQVVTGPCALSQPLAHSSNLQRGVRVDKGRGLEGGLAGGMAVGHRWRDSGRPAGSCGSSRPSSWASHTLSCSACHPSCGRSTSLWTGWRWRLGARCTGGCGERGCVRGGAWRAGGLCGTPAGHPGAVPACTLWGTARPLLGRAQQVASQQPGASAQLSWRLGRAWLHATVTAELRPGW